MSNQPIDEEDVSDLIIEKKEKRVLDRPKKLQNLIDTQAMRFLEVMDFHSFNNLSSACEQFMMEAPLFQSDISFSNAALALDLTAQLFSTIDTDKNHLLSREEFAYLLLKTNDANRQALAWLRENFNAFTQACFFKDQIGKDDIEAARNVFHGLKVTKDKFGFDKQPTTENLKELDPDKLKQLLDKNGGELTPHEAAGIKYLIDHIKKHVKDRDKDKDKDSGKEKKGEAELTDKERADRDKQLRDKQLQVLEGVLDARSLKTLKGLKLNNFDSMFNAFAEFIEDRTGYEGDSSFTKAANALDTTANVVNGLEMPADHEFTGNEMLIVSKMSSGKEKKPLGWIAKHFDAFTRAFFLGNKAKKRDILAARNVFNGLGFVKDRFDLDDAQAEKLIKEYLSKNRAALDTRNQAGLEQLVEFMERHTRGI